MESSPLDQTWKNALQAEFDSPHMQSLWDFLAAEKKQGKDIYPKETEIFRALNLTPLKKTRVVILGQDPYHGEGQAHGLSFSVPVGVKVPPSLVNIYKEQERDLGLNQPKHGFLEPWSKQGVLLLNAVLTVEKGCAASHQKKGWEKFTDAIIRIINTETSHIAFLLWGSYAQKKASFVDQDRHLVLKAPHPSPLSAHRGFIGCGHFSEANKYLEANGYEPIDWQLS